MDLRLRFQMLLWIEAVKGNLYTIRGMGTNWISVGDHGGDTVDKLLMLKVDEMSSGLCWGKS